MSDYEIVFMFNEYASTSTDMFMNVVTVISAYLIAGYLVAAKLKRGMAILVTILFTAALFQAVLSMLGFWSDAVSLMPEIQV